MQYTVKMTKAGAAGLAKTTAGRSRVFKDRTKYDRKRDKKNHEGSK